MIGRSLEGEDGFEAEICGDLANNLLGPLIERELRALLSRRLEKRPDHRADIADDGDRARLVRSTGEQRLSPIKFERPKPFQAIVVQS